MARSLSSNGKGQEPAGISEVASENQPARKRGRPEAVPPEALAVYARMFPEIKTRRGLQERCYAGLAIRALSDDPAFEWLVSTREQIAGGTSRLRHTILAELGRVSDERMIKEMARLLCKQRPTAKRAAALIRRWRRAPCRDASILGLAAALEGCVNDYLATHPGTTAQMI